MNGRSLAVLGLVALAGGSLAAASAVPASTAGGASRAVRAQAAAGRTQLVCSGPETAVAPEGGSASPPPAPLTVTALAVPPNEQPFTWTLAGVAKPPPAQRFTAGPPSVDPDTGATGSTQVMTATRDAPGAVVVQARGATTVPAAVQSTLVRDGDLRGLATSPCLQPSADQWFVGGGTRTGRRARLLLTNLAPTPAVVDVSVLGESGPAGPGAPGVVVAPHAQKAILVDAIAPQLERIAVHVSARTGRVAATLQDTVLRGLTPGGTDDVPPAAAPALRQVVPGLAITAAPAGASAATLGAPGLSVLRVANPGTQDAVARVRLLGGSGPVDFPAAAAVRVAAGSVVDVPLVGLTAGSYAATVTADVPVLAGAVLGRTAGADVSELAWTASTGPLAGTLAALLPLPVPAGDPAAGATVRGTLELVAPQDRAVVEVRDVGADGSLGPLRTITVPGGQTVSVPVTGIGARMTVLAGLGPLHAAALGVVDDPNGPMISAVAIQPPAQAPGVPMLRDDPTAGQG